LHKAEIRLALVDGAREADFLWTDERKESALMIVNNSDSEYAEELT
jgi:hypothetical protein